ncbi:MAG: hypothetical protein WC222_07355 [Parachlamydiales bacterium]
MSKIDLLKPLKRLITRWRYPVCCPEDISQALGLRLSNQLTFDELINQLTSPHCSINSLYKYMNRSAAEASFGNALRVERFLHTTLVSYFFSEGWMEFNLHFDDDGKLRRLYLQHHCIPSNIGVEIALRNPDTIFKSVGSRYATACNH